MDFVPLWNEVIAGVFLDVFLLAPPLAADGERDNLWNISVVILFAHSTKKTRHPSLPSFTALSSNA